MLPEKEKKELFSKLSAIRRRVTDLRQELNQINELKEAAFREKDKHGMAIVELIRKVKKLKEERNALTAKVKEAKAKRDQISTAITSEIGTIKNLNKQAKPAERKLSPGALKHAIDALEMKIETEAMGFEKEKKVMKQINALKKQYEEAKNLSKAWEETDKKKQGIGALREERREVHQSVQIDAQESQARHEEMITLSKQVDELKVKEEAAFKTFIEHKKKFNEVNEKLKEALMELQPLNELIQKHQLESADLRRERKERTLRDLEREVDEKIKRGEKLTTEDLLAFQQSFGK